MNNSSYLLNVSAVAENMSARPASSLILSRRKQVELIAWIGLTAAISFTGIFFNLAALFVTFWKRTRESAFNILMTHFVAINFFICLVNLPVHAFMVLAKQHGYHIPNVVCRPVQFFFAFGCAVCNWADVCLSVNRFVAIVFPLKYKWWSSKWVNLGMVIFGWSICTAATLPLCYGLGGSMPLMSMGQCGFLPTGRWGMLITAINAYIPYAIIAAASAAIWIRILLIQRANNRVTSGDAIKPNVISRRRLVVARMLLMTTVWSAICNIPWGVIQFNFPYLYGTDPVSVLWLRTVQAVQYGFSPIILYATNEDYRKRFAALQTRLLGRPVNRLRTTGGAQSSIDGGRSLAATRGTDMD